MVRLPRKLIIENDVIGLVSWDHVLGQNQNKIVGSQRFYAYYIFLAYPSQWTTVPQKKFTHAQGYHLGSLSVLV